MRQALDEYLIEGVSHNIPFLAALVAHPRFQEGRLTTNFIAEEYPDGFRYEDVPHDNPLVLVAVAAAMHQSYQERAVTISGQVPGFKAGIDGDWTVVLDGRHYSAMVSVVGQVSYVTT